MVRKYTSGIVKKRIMVKAKQIKRLTGWDDKEMMDARRKGWITWEYTEADGFNYDIKSLDPLLIKTPNHATT